MLYWILLSFSFLLHPNYFCIKSPIIYASDKLSLLPAKNVSLVLRRRTSSISVTSSFFTIHSSSAKLVEPNTLYIFPFLILFASDPKLRYNCAPISPFSLIRAILSAYDAEPSKGRPFVCDYGYYFPYSFSFCTIISTNSSPILR